MSCPDCKDGFYYPLMGPREPCQTCSHKATITIDAKVVEAADRNLRAVEGLYRMSGLPVFNPCPKCQWLKQEGKACINCNFPCGKCGQPKVAGNYCSHCTKVPDASELFCESRISASKSSLQRLYRQFLSKYPTMTISELAQKLSKSPAHVIDILEGDHGEA